MNNIDNKIDNNNMLSVNWKLDKLEAELPSTNEHRLIDFCLNSPDLNDLENICSVLNNEFSSLLKDIDFNKAISKLERPIWKIS